MEAVAPSRRLATMLLGLVTGLGSLLVIYFSRDLIALATLDEWVGTNVIVLLALGQVLLFGWVFGAERGYRFAQHGAELRLPRAFVFLIKYVTPLYLVFVLGSWIYRDLPGSLRRVSESTGATAAIGLIVVTGALFLILAHVGGRRWNARDATPDDRDPAGSSEATS